LLSNADKLANKLRAEQKANEIKKSIAKIAQKKLEVDPYKFLKRRKSFKGVQVPFLQGFEYEEWDETVKAKKRPCSRQYKRKHLNRKYPKEHHFDMDDTGSHGDGTYDSDEGGHASKNHLQMSSNLPVDPLMPSGGGSKDMMG